MTTEREHVASAVVSEGVSGLLGADRVEIGKDGIQVSSPRSDGEAADLLRLAAEKGWRVLPYGCGLERTTVCVGARGEGSSGVARSPDLIVSSLGMTGVVDHEPGDLSVRVRAGTTLGDVQSVVSAAGQWLPLDPPGGPEATLGGIAATGIGGPLRSGYGRPRDQILGSTVVDGVGRRLVLGGRVVKNVAGFDLVRLAVGSRGTLGLITELVFRLYPLPEDDRTLVWCRDAVVSGWELGRSAATLPIPVAAAELLVGDWPAPVPAARASVLIRLTGSSKEVREVADLMIRRVGDPDREIEGSASREVFEAVSRAQASERAHFRAHSLPSHGMELLHAVEDEPIRRVALDLLGGSVQGVLDEEISEAEALALADRLGRNGAKGGSGRASMPNASRVRRLRADILRGFDPGGILPGAWREGWM